MSVTAVDELAAAFRDTAELMLEGFRRPRALERMADLGGSGHSTAMRHHLPVVLRNMR